MKMLVWHCFYFFERSCHCRIISILSRLLLSTKSAFSVTVSLVQRPYPSDTQRMLIPRNPAVHDCRTLLWKRCCKSTLHPQNPAQNSRKPNQVIPTTIFPTASPIPTPSPIQSNPHAHQPRIKPLLQSSQAPSHPPPPPHPSPPAPLPLPLLPPHPHPRRPRPPPRPLLGRHTPRILRRSISFPPPPHARRPRRRDHPSPRESRGRHTRRRCVEGIARCVAPARACEICGCLRLRGGWLGVVVDAEVGG